jgi:O-antigen ligase
LERKTFILSFELEADFMKVSQRQTDLRRIFSIIFFPMLMFNVLGETVFQPYRDQARRMDDITLYLSLFLLIYIFIREERLGLEYKKIYLGFILLSSVYTFGFIYNNTFDHTTQFITLFLTFVFILACMKIRWTPDHLILFGHLANILIFLFMYHWISTDFITLTYKAIFGNPNVFTAFLFSLLYFQIVSIKSKTLISKIYFTAGTLANLVITFMTTSRTVVLAIAFIVGSWLILKYSRRWFYKLFFIVIGGNFVFLGTYVMLARSPFVDGMNQVSLKYTNKLLFSGRENIWGGVIDYGMTSPWIGHRVGIQMKEYLPNLPYYHTHNQYLQVFVESGFLGLFCFLLLLFFIWDAYQKNLDSHYVQWSACFFLGLLVYQNIEISLFLNMMSIGLIQWLIISIGVSQSLNGVGSSPDTIDNRTRRRRRRLSFK